MKKIALVLFAVCILSCKHKHKYNPEAVKLNDSAIKLAMSASGADSLQAVINLLNKATTIDSNYYIAYWNKVSFQLRLKRYDDALKTAKQLVRLRSSEAYTQALVGNIFEMKGDSISSKPYFNASLQLYNKILSTMDNKDNQYSYNEFGKAVDLIMLNRQSEGNALLKKLYDDTPDTSLKQVYKPFIGKDRKSVLDMLKNDEYPFH